MGGGYRPELPAGERDSLIQAVKKAMLSEPPGEWKEVPAQFFLGQNYPNPCNPTTHIDYVIPVPSRVSLKIYNTLGEQVTTIFERDMQPGRYTEIWSPSRLASGIYLYRLFARTTNGQAFVQTRKLILLK